MAAIILAQISQEGLSKCLSYLQVYSFPYFMVVYGFVGRDWIGGRVEGRDWMGGGMVAAF